jgi:hypothetical protein
MRSSRQISGLLLLSACPWLLDCSNSSGGDEPVQRAGSGGSAAGSGGGPARGGAAGQPSGGLVATGGLAPSGGQTAVGGTQAVGGSTGGSPGGSTAAGQGGKSTGGRAGGAGNTSQGGAGAGMAGGTNAGGGAGAGGTAGSGGAGNGGTGGGGSELSDSYPCNGADDAYDVVVASSGNTWSAVRGSKSLYSGNQLAAALQAGLDGLTANRTEKESLIVRGSGDIPASTRVSVGSYTVLNVCGTLNVTGSGTGDMAPIYARGRTDIDIPNAAITGSPVYGMFFRDVDNLRLGRIELKMSAGLGIRIDNNAGAVRRKNVSIDYVYGEGMSSHAVETYGVDQIRIGTVEAKDTGECGLLLNNTSNAEVGLVSCDNCGAGTGYAAFRIANDAGKIGDDWPAGNIHVGKVVARRGGRGIFSVSGSGGLTIDEIDLANTGNNAILLQNCYNTTIAAKSGTVVGGTVLLSNDTENTNSGRYEPSRDVTLQNLTLSGGASVTEAWCDLGDRGNRARNISGGTVDPCFD